MLRPFRLFVTERVTLFLALLSALFIFFSFFWVLTHADRSAAAIPIHYNVLVGIDLLAPWYAVLWYVLAALVVFTVNLFLAFRIFAKDKYLSYYLGLSSVFCSFFLALYVIMLSTYR
ncbi:MAG: hypothetical protein A3B30_00135 [Candidatus Komeilibacteria bacterium RIFCSPLOWO2_01_FULL_52_15]|uniref:DUF1648 domain-containing protein n=2 Tax=Candidatus Komeiliibacteriota TaxID=1817908 RepID=A0A1G2BPA5_9BACT|nr:MAG: hypothetical protein A2677_01995 [Candidatus Komeilibacteria bacterium RIFCSPHIGHO2_01_FULL_52_14]OGY90963.1 MAG: hypothetical protein A3B30_00135 [Candidatus Komeilibacteria bacterium RIFCSPLOWO2_01_FULL_52_15]